MGTQDLMTETIMKRSVILNLQLKPKKVLLTVQVVKVVKENNQLRETFSNLRRVVKEMLQQPDKIFVSESPQGKISKFEKILTGNSPAVNARMVPKLKVFTKPILAHKAKVLRVIAAAVPH